MNLNKYFKAGLFLILVSVLISNPVLSQNVSLNTAQKLARSFFTTKNKSLNSEATLATAKVSEKDTLFYIFNNGNNGYVLVSGDYSVYPVLGYSDEGKFITEQLSPEVKYWLDGYASEIRSKKLNKRNTTVNPAWKKFLDKGFAKTTKGMNNGVNPLTLTTWSQGPGYNNLCPACSCPEWNNKCVTGCVATAMGQIMKYFNYPVHGVGSHCYTHLQYGQLCADFSTETYDWSNMNSNSGGAIPLLLRDCGYSVNMDYTPTGSGSSNDLAANALIQYFDYRNTITNQYRSSSTFDDLTWNAMLTSNLDLHQPILYGGDAADGGHAWVCDGYQTDAFDTLYYHFNWGWQGTDDGYFMLNNLDAGDIEGNGVDYNFTNGQTAVVNIAPYYAPYCMPNLTLTASIGEISDGSGPSFYWANTNCDWLIEPPNAKNIVLYFDDFCTLQGTDVVNVYQGDNTTIPLGHFSGNDIPPIILDTTGKMLITFSSVGQDSGWDAIYYVPVQYCSGTKTFTKSTGVIHDSIGYWPHADCDWLIEPAGAKNVALIFNKFSTVKGMDFVSVFDGDNTSTGKEIFRYSGDSLKADTTIIANSGKMLITFTSKWTGSGWDATYYTNTAAGINEHSGSGGIEIYPNPVKDVINLTTSKGIGGHAIVNIYDITGQMVYSRDISLNNSTNSLDVSSLNPGMYILEVLNNNETLKFKIFKQ